MSADQQHTYSCRMDPCLSACSGRSPSAVRLPLSAVITGTSESTKPFRSSTRTARPCHPLDSSDEPAASTGPGLQTSSAAPGLFNWVRGPPERRVASPYGVGNGG